MANQKNEPSAFSHMIGLFFCNTDILLAAWERIFLPQSVRQNTSSNVSLQDVIPVVYLPQYPNFFPKTFSQSQFLKFFKIFGKNDFEKMFLGKMPPHPLGFWREVEKVRETVNKNRPLFRTRVGLMSA